MEKNLDLPRLTLAMEKPRSILPRLRACLMGLPFLPDKQNLADFHMLRRLRRVTPVFGKEQIRSRAIFSALADEKLNMVSTHSVGIIIRSQVITEPW